MQPQLVHKIQQTLDQGGAQLFDLLPLQLRNVIKGKLWLECTDRSGVLFKSFEQFVIHPLPEGLESTIGDLIIYCRKKSDVQELIKRAAPAARSHGGARAKQPEKQAVNNRLKPGSYGGESTYLLARLKRDRPDLAELVVSGDLSANAAAIKAGFRVKTISVPVDTPEHALKPLVKIFGVAKLEKALQRYMDVR